jgi:hypothetical protein
VAQPHGQVIYVSAANLSSVQYVGGSLAGTDTLKVGVYRQDRYGARPAFDKTHRSYFVKAPGARSR